MDVAREDISQQTARTQRKGKGKGKGKGGNQYGKGAWGPSWSQNGTVRSLCARRTIEAARDEEGFSPVKPSKAARPKEAAAFLPLSPRGGARFFGKGSPCSLSDDIVPDFEVPENLPTRPETVIKQVPRKRHPKS